MHKTKIVKLFFACGKLLANALYVSIAGPVLKRACVRLGHLDIFVKITNVIIKLADIDECFNSTAGCVPPAFCVNLPGSFECECPNDPDDYVVVNDFFCERYDDLTATNSNSMNKILTNGLITNEYSMVELTTLF